MEIFFDYINNLGNQFIDPKKRVFLAYIFLSFLIALLWFVYIKKINFKDKIADYWTQLKLIFSPSTGAYKGVGGFKAIFDIFPDTWSWPDFWNLTAFLSIMLGVLNLLPIPALDGGHVMFLLYEMISGRKPSDKFMEYAQMVGFFILIALVLFANGNDIFKAIFN